MRTITAIAIFILSILMGKAQNTLYITANGETRTAILESNASVEELKALLPLTIHMSDYGGWEKVGDLPRSITRDDRQMTAHPGDIMLYQGRSIVIFYGDNSWAYTPLGRIDNASGTSIKEFLSGNSVDVTFSLSKEAAVSTMDGDDNLPKHVYDISGRKIELDGKPISELPAGLYIINGEKTLIR